jgi:hypothetical protein
MQAPGNRKRNWLDPTDLDKLGIAETFARLGKRDRRKLERYQIIPPKLLRLAIENGILSKEVEIPSTGLTVEGLVEFWNGEPRPRKYVQQGRHYFLQLLAAVICHTPQRLWNPVNRSWEWADLFGIRRNGKGKNRREIP